MNFTSDQDIQDYIDNYSEEYKAALPKEDERGLTINWKYDIRFGLESEITHLSLVSKMGGLEGKLKKAIGQVMMAFWSGVGYVYRLISCPLYRPMIKKENIQFDLPEIPDENDPIWARLAETKCLKK